MSRCGPWWRAVAMLMAGAAFSCPAQPVTDVAPSVLAPLSDAILVDDLPADFPADERAPIMLWQASRGDAVVSIIGSLHMADTSIYPLPAAMQDALRQAEFVALEVHPDDMNEAFMRRMRDAGQLPAGQTLEELLTPETRARLDAALERNDLPANAVSAMRPWYAALALTFSETLRPVRPRVSINEGIDRHVMMQCRTSGKPMRGLESAEDQLALFTGLDGDVSLAFLEKTLDELEELDATLDGLLTTWKRGDAAGLWTIVQKSFADFPVVYETWMAARNRAWAESIDAWAVDHHAFLVVCGAGHVVGPDGLPELLRARGFMVHQSVNGKPHATP